MLRRPCGPPGRPRRPPCAKSRLRLCEAKCSAKAFWHFCKLLDSTNLQIRGVQDGLEEPARLDRAGVPPEQRRELTKGQIALELLDQARAEGWPGRVVVADAAYGVSGPFRRELEARDLHYVVGVSEQMIVFAEPPRWEWPDPAVRGRSAPGGRPGLVKDAPEPVTLAELAARTPLRRVTWRHGTKGPLSARFAWLRVWPA